MQAPDPHHGEGCRSARSSFRPAQAPAGHILRRVGVLVSALLIAPPALAQTAPEQPAMPLQIGSSPSRDMIALAPEGLTKALAALPAAIQDIMQRSAVPGMAVGVVHGGKTVFAQGFGVREIGKDAPVTPDTVFQIASLSKPIAATIAAIEITKGGVSWDDEVIRYLPGFKLADPYVTTHATIGDFFAHRSGLPHAAGDELEDLGFDRKAIIGRLKYLPLDRFRLSYHYANFGITIGAEAIAAAAGLPWEDLANKALFAPLNMSSTSGRHADFLNRPNRAVLHAREKGRFQPLYDRNPDAQSPAGGVSSSITDLTEWLKLLLAGGTWHGQPIIKPDVLASMLRPQAFSAPSSSLNARSGFYGYGFNVVVNANGRPAMSHSGAFALGAGTTMLIVPSADFGIVVLTNGAPSGAAEAVAAQFASIVQYGEPTRDWYSLYHPLLAAMSDPVGDLVDAQQPKDPAPAHPLEIYAGEYGNAYFGPASISRDGHTLQMKLGPKGDVLKLTPWGADTFALAPRSENEPSGSLSSVKFHVVDGKSVSFTVNYLDANGVGTWAR